MARPLMKALPAGSGSGPPVPGEDGPARRDGEEAEAARSSTPPAVIRSLARWRRREGGAGGGRARGGSEATPCPPLPQPFPPRPLAALRGVAAGAIFSPEVGVGGMLRDPRRGPIWGVCY